MNHKILSMACYAIDLDASQIAAKSGTHKRRVLAACSPKYYGYNNELHNEKILSVCANHFDFDKLDVNSRDPSVLRVATRAWVLANNIDIKSDPQQHSIRMLCRRNKPLSLYNAFFAKRGIYNCIATQNLIKQIQEATA